MPIFKLNEETYNIPDNIVNQFKKDNPEATETKEPGKISPTSPGAVVEEIAAPESQVTESISENTFSDLQSPKKRKELNFTYSEEQKYLRNKTIPERLTKKKFTEEQMQDSSFIDEKYKLPSIGELYAKDKNRLKEIDELNSIEEEKIIQNISDQDQQIQMINDLKNQYKTEVDQINKKNEPYDKVIEQISKDTGGVGNITNLFNFGAAANAEATQIIDLDNDIAGAVINIVKNKKIPVEKIIQGRITLDEKEDLINQGKLQVLNNKITTEVEDYSVKYENQLQQLTYLNNKINILSGGDGSMDALDSPNRINEFNETVKSYNNTLSDSKAELKKFNERTEALQAQYTIQQGDKIIRNFKKFFISIF